ncbi:MAG TPA: LCP family protein [Marmoricola sp.]|nr:LCP family protein [Marmoricola sp.]
MRRVVRSVVVLLLGLALLGLPDPARQPIRLSLVRVETAKAVDFEQGIVWVLVLGSDAPDGTDVMDGRADAIQLVGIDFDQGAAVAVGVPRDLWVETPGEGFDRINAGLRSGGPEQMARSVRRLVGVAPDFVLTTGFDGFEDMVDSIGPLTVRSTRAFEDPEEDLTVRRGLNSMDGQDALGFARARVALPRGDFDRSANHQQLLRAALRRLRAREDVEGFVERGVFAAISGLDTELSPADLYRLAQALTTIDLTRLTACVLPGTPGVESGAQVLYPDVTLSRRVGNDIRGDAELDRGCSP